MLASIITLAAVLIAVIVFHAWSAYQWTKERTEMFREITNLAIARSPADVRNLRADPPTPVDLPDPWPDGYENMVGM